MTRKFWSTLFLLFCFLALPLLPQKAAQLGTDNDRTQTKRPIDIVKCGLIFRCSVFVDWPETAGMKNSGQPFIIGVVGPENVFNAINKVWPQNKTIKNKTALLKRIESNRDIDACHVLVLTTMAVERFNEVMEYTKGKPVLTIGYYNDYDEMGVHITLLWENNRLLFNIDRGALSRSGLKAHIKLYPHAYKIYDHRDGKNK